LNYILYIKYRNVYIALVMFWLITFADLCDFRILTQIMFVCLMALNTIKQANIICVSPKNPKHNCNEVQGLYFSKWGWSKYFWDL